ncbi:hypothetical protein DFH06DRAFT_1345972 [Mycena polygramma]|nr:hypothetical protein DFH06DRAFT_1345972 [Mycena polygramma]
MGYEDGIQASVIRAAGLEVADRLLPGGARSYDRHDQPRHDYDYRRHRSLSPRSTSGSSTSRDTYERGGRAYGRGGYASMRYPDAYERRGSPGDEHSLRYHDSGTHGRRSPSPDNRGRRYYEDRRGSQRRGRGNGRGRPWHRGNNDANFNNAPYLSPAGWKRTVFPPDARLVVRDPVGHPLFSAELASADDATAGAKGSMLPPKDYPANETERRNKALAEESAGRHFGKVTNLLTIDSAGVWATAGPVTTFSQAVNLARWVTHGDKQAREFLRALVTRLCTDPTLPRSLGAVVLLQHQNRLMSTYDTVVYGARIVKSKPANSGGCSTFPFGAPPPPPSPPPVRTATPVFLGAVRRASDNTTRVHLEEELGEDSVAQRGTVPSLEHASHWYTSIATDRWPKGMRVSYEALPSTPSAAPWAPDVAAWFTMNALAPARGDDPSSIHRVGFMHAAVQLLSIPGTFNHYAEEGGYLFDTLPGEHFPFGMMNPSFAHVVAWFMQHGIDKGSDALACLEGFARARRNHIAGAAEVTAMVFDDGHPKAMHEVDGIVLNDEDKWANLHFGPPRTNVTTTYPEFPAGEQRSIHAPETRMDESEG